MPIHPALPAITYELSVVKNDETVAEANLDGYVSFTGGGGKLVLKPTNAPYTVTLTAKAGDKSVSHSITVNKGESTGEISTINLSLGDAEIRYHDGKYYYVQNKGTQETEITENILITGFAANGSVTVMGGSPTLIINQNDPGDVWTLYSGESADQITLQPRSFNNKLHFGAAGSTMPELSYVSAAPKLKLNPDQGDITFNADESVTQGNFTITQLKNDEKIVVWGADAEATRTVTNSTSADLTVEINGESVQLAADNGAYTVEKADATQRGTTTKSYLFAQDDGGYALLAVGEGDASAPQFENSIQRNIHSALFDDDFTGTLYADNMLYAVNLTELHAEQFSDISVYSSVLGHVYLGANLTELSWGNYCVTSAISVDEENPYFVNDDNGVLYTKDYSTLLVIPAQMLGDYTIHENCTTIKANGTMRLNLDTLTIGKNVRTIEGGIYRFYDNHLSAIYVEAGNQYFASKDGILYNKDMTAIIAFPKNIAMTTLEIPETVKNVADLIFEDTGIEKVVIPAGANITGGIDGLSRMVNLKEIELLGSYSGRLDQAELLNKVTVADGFNFNGNTFDNTSMKWIKNAGITVTGGENTPYDGQAHSVTVTAAEGLTVEYLQADGSWGGTAPSYTDAGTYTVEWRITKPADETCSFARELYSSRTFTITALEADESWFTLTAVKPDNPDEDFTPVKLDQPDAAPSLENGYTVTYSKDGTGTPIEDVPAATGSYLVKVSITANGYAPETLTLGYYTILAEADSGKKVLSFVTNGGDPIQPIIETAGNNISDKVPTEPTRDGYTFAGWYEDVTLRTKVESLPTTMPSESATYYAKWTRISYNITYNLDGGTDPGNPTTYHVETPTFTLIAPTKPGYEFTGWTGSNGETAQKEVSIAKGSIGNREYTANWEMITYTITYPNTYDRVDGNPASYTVESSNLNITSPAEREGYTFAGWTMVVDGTSYILPAENAAIPAGTLGNITLTGIWLADEQTLKLDANGGQFADGSTTGTITAEYGSSITLTQPTRAGYNFFGWYIDEDCTVAFDGDLTTMPLTATLYARWKRIPNSGGTGGSGSSTYSVSVPAASSIQGGSITVSPRSAERGDTVTITVKPDKGYELDELTVTDGNGKSVKLSAKGDNKFSFTMPASRVKIAVTFKQTDDGQSSPFADVPESAWYYDAVLWAVENGITNGTSSVTFSPDVTVSRAQMVTFLWRAAGAPKATGSNPFTDVAQDAWYYDAVLWAVASGITNGTNAAGTTFSPDEPVTRAQAVTFLYRELAD